MKYTLTILLAIAFTFATQAQCKTTTLNDDKSKIVSVCYSLKDTKEGKTAVKVKFKNKAKTAINVNTTLGFYSNGVLVEKVEVADCLKKSCFNNWFRPYHLVETEGISSTELKSDDIKIEVLDIVTTETDECRKTDS